jgi:hypothetical protein
MIVRNADADADVDATLTAHRFLKVVFWYEGRT